MKKLASSALFFALASLAIGRTALASHYAVTEVPRLITPASSPRKGMTLAT